MSLTRPTLHRLPHPAEGFPPTTGQVRDIRHAEEAKPRREVIYRHIPSGQLFAVPPGSQALRRLRQSDDPHRWEQVHTFHTEQRKGSRR